MIMSNDILPYLGQVWLLYVPIAVYGVGLTNMRGEILINLKTTTISEKNDIK